MEQLKRPSVVRFGVFEADLESGELRKGGSKIRLQQQPFKILEVLLERPGEVVTREDLRSRIWPSESFGDFDQAVNVAIAKLRSALGDSSEGSRFVETLPRRGYRFVAPVQPSPVPPAAEPAPEAPRGFAQVEERRFVRFRHLVLIGSLTVLAIAIALVLVLRPKQVALDFHRITFGKGAIRTARFTSDGQSILYGAAWDGKPSQLFWMQAASPESRSYAIPNSDLLSVSSNGEMAILLNRRAGVGLTSHGTLAVLPLAGTLPHEILDEVQDADWDPDGKNLAVVHWVGNHCRIEYPIGTVIYDATGGHWVSNVRVSPRGNYLAFLDHPLEGDDAGTVSLMDLTGHKSDLTSLWTSMGTVVWDPTGDWIWFSGSEIGGGRQEPRSIYRVTLDGALNEIFQESGDLTLHDISRDGRLLVTRDVHRYEILGDIRGQYRDFSWLDFSRGDDLSPDGNYVLMSIEGEAAPRDYEVHFRRTDGSPPVKLGNGYGSAISPDGQWVLAVAPFGIDANPAPQFLLLPTGKGESKTLTNDRITHLYGNWFPDGSHIVFEGSEPGHPIRSWIMNASGGPPTPFTPEGTSGRLISPHGDMLCATDSAGKLWLYPISGGPPVEVKGVEQGDLPVRWTQDGKGLLISRTENLPVRIYTLDLATGRRRLIRELAPRDPAGVISDISQAYATADATSFVYSYYRLDSDLYVATRK
jgi:DNA-binding winged helix-turn-helix (wHTH) protein/Tol biopolymer transport system component